MEVFIMNKEMLDFYLKTSIYTNYEPYKEYYKSLPDDMFILIMNHIKNTIRVCLMTWKN